MITINDTIKIDKVVLGGEDIVVLSQMYLPIIGIDSYSLYIFLNNYNSEVKVRTILDFLHFDNIGVLEYAFNKLEAIGLVNKYFHKTKGYFYEFDLPVSKESFKANTLLSNMLIKNIGEVCYDNIFKNKDLKGYTIESKRFDEVFKTKGPVMKVFEANVPKDIKDNIVVVNDKFDYIVFKMLFEEREIDNNLLNDSNFEKEILKISYEYSLTEQEMKDAVMKSIKQNNDLKFEEIRNKAGYIYQNKTNSVSDVLFKEKKPEEYIVDLTSDENQILKWAETKSINDMLAMFSGGKGSLSDIKDFNKLKNVTGLSTDVINVLIFHLCGVKAGEALSFNYLEKVARNWIKAGIKNAKDAIIFLREKEENVKQKKTRKTVSEMPEWMNNPKDESDKQNKDNEYSEDDAKELMRKVFG